MTNILIDDAGKVKLIDFGFADFTKELTDTYCGTPAYMCPEIVEKKKYCGKRVDVWALGVLLFKLLCNYYPFGCKLVIT